MIIEKLADIGTNYDGVLCDLWGCLHNGVEAHPAAVAALQDFRTNGGKVLLLTNSPRLSPAVAEQIARLGAPENCYDEIATSGDATRAAIEATMTGKKFCLIAPEGERQGGFLEGLDIEITPIEQAEAILVLGPRDDRTETPENYRLEIAYGVNEGLPLYCANPDIVVDHGDTRIYCAGAIAQAYEEAGGTAHYFGKPHPPVYDIARERLAIHDNSRLLAIGDGIHTDIQGAVGEGIDALFITGGLAAAETGTEDQPDPDKLERFLSQAGMTPRYSMGALR
ncbi:TIGR01459 family HAD-type hydrolase [Paracoccaceae bacterium GXU_MW_L88]